jgi:pSer/pThr/pTyr-binding forkhead associated (FHA) protein
MGRVTFQAVDGLERGQIFEALSTPVTIGREEDNHIRLNDERVSRFHCKVQEHQGQYILTDLDSTNGTRVNGHPVHMHVLRIGDQVLVGRCLLIYGDPEELDELAEAEPSRGDVRETVSVGQEGDNPLDCPSMFHRPPPLPRGMNAIQTAQTSDLLAYLHTELLRGLYGIQGDVESPDPPPSVTLPTRTWRRLQQLQLHLADYLKRIAEPAE